MPSFLTKVQTKVFGRNKDDKELSRSRRTSLQSLLEGKFEAVSPTVSPSADNFVESAQKLKEREKAKEKEGGFPLFKNKSRTTSPILESSKRAEEPPHLSLNLPGIREERSSRVLSGVFEGDAGGRWTLSDAVIGETRLSPSETLGLVKTCSEAIIARGLQTLGVMHPHWYSASPDVQRRLVSLYILSLPPKTPVNAVAPTPNTDASFQSEIAYARSPHDVASVLRWGLRHLRIEGGTFGKEGAHDLSWYTAFLQAEQAASYPPNAFSDKLVPLLPTVHAELLSATLDIISSLAAHSEANGISGSKLSKMFGLWLLTANRVQESDDWTTFYSRWEHAGRILEHLFLSRIRDEAPKHRMPQRLIELVAQYPYSKGAPSEDGLLPRPRFSTRKYDTLFVRIDTEVSLGSKSKQHPLQLIGEALKAQPESTSKEYYSLWETIKRKALEQEDTDTATTEEQQQQALQDFYPLLSTIFADETIRLLSLIPHSLSGSTAQTPSDDPASPSFSPVTPVIRVNEPQPKRRRSSSIGKARAANGASSSNGHAKAASSNSPPVSPVATDWTSFSTTGFGESSRNLAATLLDNDLEVTAPPRPQFRRKLSAKRRGDSSTTRGRQSADHANGSTPATPNTPRPSSSKSTAVSLVQMDEAFVDFWSDALLDPIAAEWPNFVVCQLKALPEFKIGGKSVSWLVVEQALVQPQPPAVPEPRSPTEASGSGRASSPRPSNKSGQRKSSTFSVSKKFKLFGSQDARAGAGAASSKKEKGGKNVVRVGEMGEVLPEEDEKETAGTGGGGKRVKASVVGGAAAAGGVTVVALEEVKGLASPSAQTQPVVVDAVEEPKTEVESKDVETEATATGEALATPASSTGGEFIVEAEEEHLSAVPATVVPVDTDGQVLPPAPENVVLSGETPGPQLALATSEPAAIAQVIDEAEDEPEPIGVSPVAEEEPVAEEAPAEEAGSQGTSWLSSAMTTMNKFKDAMIPKEEEASVENVDISEPAELEPSSEPVDVSTPDAEATVVETSAAEEQVQPVEEQPLEPSSESVNDSAPTVEEPDAETSAVEEQPLESTQSVPAEVVAAPDIVEPTQTNDVDESSAQNETSTPAGLTNGQLEDQPAQDVAEPAQEPDVQDAISESQPEEPVQTEAEVEETPTPIEPFHEEEAVTPEEPKVEPEAEPEPHVTSDVPTDLGEATTENETGEVDSQHQPAVETVPQEPVLETDTANAPTLEDTEDSDDLPATSDADVLGRSRSSASVTPEGSPSQHRKPAWKP